VGIQRHGRLLMPAGLLGWMGKGTGR
jgi:hypothetical protein